eukprot:TRINITY_DN100665_c0_g1_i1.p1 TRINITY_DN100665_c0_g1~~TRINITY_DN100665_c0_g1_i1.p1  ORF type:complete len:360 (-),score=55.56 TRINITY_DN100665_c0_g1_i1:402-1481(-)
MLCHLKTKQEISLQMAVLESLEQLGRVPGGVIFAEVNVSRRTVMSLRCAAHERFVGIISLSQETHDYEPTPKRQRTTERSRVIQALCMEKVSVELEMRSPGGKPCKPQSVMQTACQLLLEILGRCGAVVVSRSTSSINASPITPVHMTFQRGRVLQYRLPALLELRSLRSSRVANCFLMNTAFRLLDGSFKLAGDLMEGDVILQPCRSRAARVTRKEQLKATDARMLVELTTAQGKLKITANHPILVITDGSERFLSAFELETEMIVKVGDKERRLTKVTRTRERADVVKLQFDPADSKAEAFVIPAYGMQVACNAGMSSGSSVAEIMPSGSSLESLMCFMASIPRDELLRAEPTCYDE